MFSEIAYFSIAGVPLLIYGGIIALTLLILTVIFGFLVHLGRIKYPIHKWFGVFTLLAALMHGALAFLARFVG